MRDYHLMEALKRIEDSITENQTTENYHNYLLASMVIKQYTIQDCYSILEKKILNCDVHDMNKSMALKHKLKMFDIERFNDNRNLAYVIKNLNSDEPLSIINNEIKQVLNDSKQLVNEIISILSDSTLTFENTNDSIIKIFDEEVQRSVEQILGNSFEIFKFYFSVDLQFTRKDGSQFIFNTELASLQQEYKVGLSGRPVMPEVFGMWYEFNREIQAGFFTKGVYKPMSVAYVTQQGIIAEIVNRKADDSTPYYNKVPAMYILEVPENWFVQNHVAVGDRVRMKTIIASC